MQIVNLNRKKGNAKDNIPRGRTSIFLREKLFLSCSFMTFAKKIRS